MRTQLRLASLLLVAVLALGSQAVHLPRFYGPIVQPVPESVRYAARESLAAINQFIADGDLAALWLTLDRTGHGLVPWPEVEASQRDLVALAYRAAYPTAHFTLAGIETAIGHYVVNLKGPVNRSFPTWLDAGSASTGPEVRLLIDIDELGTIERVQGSAAIAPLVSLAPDDGTRFALPGDSTLFAARISLLPSDNLTRYLTIHGPALVDIETGTLSIIGEGWVYVIEPGDSQWRRFAANESFTLSPGSQVSIPSGYATLSLTSHEPATFDYTGVESETDSGPTVDEDGRALPPRLAALAMSATDGPATVWFGRIQTLVSTPIQPSGSSHRLQCARVVLPPGAIVEVRDSSEFISFTLFGQSSDDVATAGALRLTNPTDRTIFEMAIRLA